MYVLSHLQSGGSVGSIVVVAIVVGGTVVGALVVVGGTVVGTGFASGGENSHTISRKRKSTSSTATKPFPLFPR